MMAMTSHSSRQPLGPALSSRVPAPWRLSLVTETVSTNADLLARAAAGEAEGAVLVTEFQSGGRGRLDRSWSSPPGAGLTFSILVRPTAPKTAWGWLPLLAGLALRDAIGEGVLKWPNDLLVGADEGKAAGILAEVAAGAAVIGVGLNVTTTRDELPVPTATSLLLDGIENGIENGIERLDRGSVLVEFLDRFGGYYRGWQDAGGDAVASGLLERYRSACATLGRSVSVELVAGRLRGEAAGIDPEGRLLIRCADRVELSAVAAGDVSHLRSDTG